MTVAVSVVREGKGKRGRGRDWDPTSPGVKSCPLVVSGLSPIQRRKIVLEEGTGSVGDHESLYSLSDTSP